MSHPAEDLDEVVHQRTRLGILAVLNEAGRAQFGYLRTTLSLSDGNLSRHLSILEAVQYVTIEKGYDGKRPRTWVTATKRGRRAYAAEMRTLKTLIESFDDSGDADDGSLRSPVRATAVEIHAATASEAAGADPARVD